MTYTGSMSSHNPHPNHIYLLVVGLVVGMVLSPWVLGNISPETYQRWIAGTGQQVQKLRDLERDQADRLERLQDTGVSSSAVAELERELNREFQAQAQQIALEAQEQVDWLRERGLAIWLAILVLMACEALFSDVSRPLVRRLTTGRYALIAVWLGMALAQPAMLRGVPVLFALLLIAVVIIMAIIPMPKRGSSPPTQTAP